MNEGVSIAWSLVRHSWTLRVHTENKERTLSIGIVMLACAMT